MEDPIVEQTLYARATETAKSLQSELPEELRTPKVAIVCGSGLGGLQHTINPGVKFEKSYADIPNWAKSTGTSHDLLHVLWIKDIGLRSTQFRAMKAN
jgi:purine-nucleoside phosphorylase